MNRIESVDFFRLLAITAVIAIHTQAFRYCSSYSLEYAVVWKYLAVFINQLARFAVPFFFVISGYFWGKKINSGNSVTSVSIPMAKRISFIFVAWSVIYLLPYNPNSIMEYGFLGTLKLTYWDLKYLIKQNPINLLMQGTGTMSHLWFLSALLCSMGISSFFVVKKYHKTLIFISLSLYIFGLFAKAYVDTPLGIHIDFNTRFGPFFGTIFFVSGYFLSYLTPNQSWFSKGLTLLAIGVFLHFLEIYLLWRLYGTSPYQDYVIGTYFMGMGAAIVSLSNNALLKIAALGKMGRFTLGVYAIHIIFTDSLYPLSALFNSPVWEISYIVLVLILSLTSVLLLSKNVYTRKLVM